MRPKLFAHPARQKLRGFTMAELLVSLLILAEIATFSIPKILMAQQMATHKSKAKAVAGMVATAFQQAKLDGVITATTASVDLIPYFNYVRLDTSSTIDTIPGFASGACTVSEPCAVLHNGGVIKFRSYNFGGATTTNTIEFMFDPDLSQNISSTANVPGKAIKFLVFYDGLLTTNGGTARNTMCNSQTCPFSPIPAYDPTWFSWN